MSETVQKSIISSGIQQNSCEHGGKLSCPVCKDQFCATCLGEHVGKHMKQTPNQL